MEHGSAGIEPDARDLFDESGENAGHGTSDGGVVRVVLREDRRTRCRVGLRRTWAIDGDLEIRKYIDFYTGEALAALPYPKPELFAAAQETLSATNAAVKNVDPKTIVDDSFVKSAADRGVDKR